jgi:hypothetical protein
MLPTVSARTTIAQLGISANPSRRQMRRNLEGGKQNNLWCEKLQPHLSMSLLKAIPALSHELL